MENTDMRSSGNKGLVFVVVLILTVAVTAPLAWFLTRQSGNATTKPATGWEQAEERARARKESVEEPKEQPPAPAAAPVKQVKQPAPPPGDGPVVRVISRGDGGPPSGVSGTGVSYGNTNNNPSGSKSGTVIRYYYYSR
jgi:hypothetical protein